MDATGNNHVEQIKPVSKQILCVFSNSWYINIKFILLSYLCFSAPLPDGSYIFYRYINITYVFMAWKWEQNCLEDQRGLMGKGNMKKDKDRENWGIYQQCIRVYTCSYVTQYHVQWMQWKCFQITLFWKSKLPKNLSTLSFMTSFWKRYTKSILVHLIMWRIKVLFSSI